MEIAKITFIVSLTPPLASTMASEFAAFDVQKEREAVKTHYLRPLSAIWRRSNARSIQCGSDLF